MDFFSFADPLIEPVVKPAEGKSFPVLAGVVCARIEVCAIKVERSIGVEAVVLVVEAFVEFVAVPESFDVLSVEVADVPVPLPVISAALPERIAVASAISEGRSVGVFVVGVAGAGAAGLAGVAGFAFDAATEAWTIRVERLVTGASDAAFAGVLGVVAAAVAVAPAGVFAGGVAPCGVGALSD